MRVSSPQDKDTSVVPGGNEDSGLRVPLTVVIPALNEAARIAQAVARLYWADELIVIDGGSTDGTPQIAAEAGAKVLQVCGSTIAAQRNAGFASARNSWVFALDVDENVPEALCQEMVSVLKAPKHAAYQVRFRNFYLGQELRHGSWGRDWHVRLFQSRFRFVEKRVHEALEPVDDLGSLSSCIEHTPYKDLQDHLRKMNRYALWGALDLHARGRQPRFGDLTLVPAWRFLREYVVYSGWRDGKIGLLAAAMGACAAFLKYAYLCSIYWSNEHPEKVPLQNVAEYKQASQNHQS